MSSPPSGTFVTACLASRLPDSLARNNIKRSSRRLRQVISAPDFEALFGPAQPHPKGERQNIFGMEDELKVAPKGVDKTHKYALLIPQSWAHIADGAIGISTC